MPRAINGWADFSVHAFWNEQIRHADKEASEMWTASSFERVLYFVDLKVIFF